MLKGDIVSKKAMMVALFVVLIAFFAFFCVRNVEKSTSNLDEQTAVSLTYDKVVSGEEKINGTDYVTFDAFFLYDLDDDGYAESVRGTCNEINSTATLYMELDVLTQGSFEDGEITINGENFYLKTAIPADNEVKTSAIGNDITTISLNTITNGTQKLLSGTVHSGSSLAALNKNIYNYNNISSVTLTGTYVAEDGTRTQISKTVYVTVDWYGTATAQMPTTLAGRDNTTQEQDITTAINEEEGTFTVEVTVGMQEVDYELLLSGAYIYGVIPDLAGYDATNVEITGTNVTYTWNADTQEFTAQRVATVDSDGKITTQAYDGTYGTARYNKFKFTITYPLEAYKSTGSDTMTYILTANGYYEGYNNDSNSVFENPYVSSTVTQSFVVIIGDIPDGTISYDITVGKARYINGNSSYVISKENPLLLYNQIDEELSEDYYTVKWQVQTGTGGSTDGVILKESNTDEADVADQIITSTGAYESMEDFVTNVGIYFNGASSMLGTSGWIKVYNDETDALIATFDSSTWNTYTSSNPYYYDEPVKHIRIETSSTNASSIFYVYSIKEIDDEYLVSNYMESEFDNFSYIYSTLAGYVTGQSDITTISNVAYYEAPFAYATLGVSVSTLSTQLTEENVQITISTIANTYNEEEWANGSFLIKMPEDIVSVDINNVTVNNDNVTITSYEKYEEDGVIYIKINTDNEEECTYTITVDANLTPDPRMTTSTEEMTLYYVNENAVAYYSETTDVYDVDDDLNTEEEIGTTAVSISLVSPNSLLTSETVTNYDDEGSITIAPNVAGVDKEQETADINVSITNNYSSTISNVDILGRVPYEGNSYVINGSDLGSTFTATMQEGGIVVPDEIAQYVTVYYSTNGEATKDLSDTQNGWVTANYVTDWSQIKSYLIDLGDLVLNAGDSYEFTYTVDIPSGLEYNDVSYSHHAVYFTLDTTDGKYTTYTEPNKVGIALVKEFDLELTKYQIYTDNLVSGATYRVTDTSTGEYRTATTNSSGVLKLEGLYVNRTYTVQEIKSPSSYELNTEVITFTAVDQDGTLVLESYTGDTRSIDVVQATDDEIYKVTIETEDEIKADIKIQKSGSDSQILSGVKFYLNGKTITTDEDGIASLTGLTIGDEYTLQETSTNDGYYLPESTVTFKIVDNAGVYSLNITSDEGGLISSNTITLIDGTPTAMLYITDEKIPTYNLEMLKIESDDDSQTGLPSARYELYSQDLGTSAYLTTDTLGTATFEGLYNYVDGKYITGVYTLREIQSPDGYATSTDEIQFRVELIDEELQIVILNESDLTSLLSYVVEDGVVKFVVQDDPLFSLTKVDETTYEGLPNAKFIIYEVDYNNEIIDYAKDKNGEYVGEIDSNGDYVITTDENGQYNETLKSGYYKAVEIEAPTGYELAEDEEERTTYFVIEGYDVDLEISTVNEFLEFAEDDGQTYDGMVVSLEADLDLTGVDYTPRESFYGTFLGNGHTISNVTIESNNWEVGLFNYIENATIRDLNIENISITTAISDGSWTAVGGLVAWAYSSNIINCNVVASIETSGFTTGGCVGVLTGDIEYSNISNCTASGEITLESGVVELGSLSGYSHYSEIENSSSNTEITIESTVLSDDNTITWVGGLLGMSCYDNITNCYNSGSITCYCEDVKLRVGGLIGQNTESGMAKCYNLGNINITEAKDVSAGGIIGQASDGGTLTECYNQGNITSVCSSSWSDVGGICGYSTMDNTNCYNTGNISAQSGSDNFVGGITGYEGHNVNCYNTGTIEGTSVNGTAYAGGISGQIYLNTPIENCYNTGNVTSTTYTDVAFAGGIIGDNWTNILCCYNTGNVSGISTGSWEAAVGGITGRTWGGSLINCYNKGVLYGTSLNYFTFMGGMMGVSSGANQIINCYNWGEFSTDTNYWADIGGIIGYINERWDDEGAEIINCYNWSELSSEYWADIGGIIGNGGGSDYTTATNVYYLESFSDYGIYRSDDPSISMTDEQMKSTDFVDTLNSNISSITTTTELLEWYGTETYPEFELDLSFEITITEEAEIVNATEVVIENSKLQYVITTEVGLNSDNERAGGTITGVYNDDYLETDNIEYVETVSYSENAIESILITPDSGYQVASITLDGNDVEYTVADDGTVILDALESVTANHHYVVTFETDMAQIIVHHILLDKDGNIAEDEDGNTIYVAEDENYTKKSGTAYTTSPNLDTGYKIATYGEMSDSLIVGNAGDDDEYYIPGNSYGYYSSAQAIEITYYYVEEKAVVTVYHYIEGTEEFVPVASEDVQTTLSYTDYVGEPYETYALTDDELNPSYELVETPANATGTYTENETTVIYYYTLVERNLTIIKSNDDGELLEGVEFSITDSEGKTQTYTTNSSGKIAVTLTYGTYTVKETATLEGYELDETEYTINVTKDDNSYTLTIGNSKIATQVIVYHYIYDREAQDPYTTTFVPLEDGTDAEEVVIEGYVGDEYYTYLADVNEDYSYVESVGQTSGNMTENTIYVYYYYELTKTATSVHVTYIDADTLEELADDVTIDGYVDDEYETEDKIDEINSTYDNKYELVSTTDNTQGTMTEQTIEVIYYYSKKETSVIVKHQTGDGTDLVDPEQIDGKIDDEYQTDPKEFDEYELKTTPDNATGTMTEEQITVIYVYSLVEGSVTITKVDKTDETKTLSGATYKIEKLDDAGDVDSTFTAIEATTGEDGIATFESLTVGSYRITEIQAPDGYELAIDSIDVQITKDDRDITIKATDKASLVLPTTGGINYTIIFVISGIAVIAIAIYFKQKNKKQIKEN